MEISGSILKILKGIVNPRRVEKQKSIFSLQIKPQIFPLEAMSRVQTLPRLSLVCYGSGKKFGRRDIGGHAGETLKHMALATGGYQKGHITQLM